ncbi:hypothetical protein [Planctomycetes bacterium Pla163]|uniref:hypothetical protein n=1 Tax=Rohdeia mirabilis TaxID=2528008 RepID=UPI0011A1003E
MQILGPILVAGAVAGGALIVSLFVTPRPSTVSDLGGDGLYVAAVDAGAVGSDPSPIDPRTVPSDLDVVPMVPLFPALRSESPEPVTGRPSGVLERFVGEGGVDALRSFVEQVERVATRNAASQNAGG